MSELQIPPSLVACLDSKPDDLRVTKDGEVYVLERAVKTPFHVTGGFDWYEDSRDPRIVAAMCRCAWLDEADRRWRQGNGEGVRPELAAEQAEAWRRYGEGER